MVYSNNHRPHQALGGITPKQAAEKISQQVASAN